MNLKELEELYSNDSKEMDMLDSIFDLDEKIHCGKVTKLDELNHDQWDYLVLSASHYFNERHKLTSMNSNFVKLVGVVAFSGCIVGVLISAISYWLFH